MLYHTGYRLIDKDDLLLLSTAVYISSHGIVFLSRSYLPAYLSNGKATRVYIYIYVYVFIHVYHIYLYLCICTHEQERIEEADFDGLSRFIKFQELGSCTIHRCVRSRDDRASL